jgi:hypothetical protein
VRVLALAADDAPCSVDAAPAAVVAAAVTATYPPDGNAVNTPTYGAVSPTLAAAKVVAPKFTATAEFTFGDEVWVVKLIDEVKVTAETPACTGTTDKSPNPSEATATADTFFNEIVFTIFLSFSQIKEFLLSGW